MSEGKFLGIPLVLIYLLLGIVLPILLVMTIYQFATMDRLGELKEQVTVWQQNAFKEHTSTVSAEPVSPVPIITPIPSVVKSSVKTTTPAAQPKTSPEGVEVGQ